MAYYMYACTLFLGYVQGMNELLSPLMIVLQSEHQSFWCLVNVLQRMVCHCCLSVCLSVCYQSTALARCLCKKMNILSVYGDIRL